MITIDGIGYKIGIIKVTRKATINYENHGTTLDGIEHADPLGTYYDYEVTINTLALNVAEYDSLYEVLTAPVEYHFVTLPYGQESISFRARIKLSSDNINANYKNFRSWTGLKITFEAIEPQRQVD